MKKKIFLLPLVAGLFLSGCKFSLFGKTIYLFEEKPKQQDNTGDVTPEDTNQHASKLTLDPNAPFYLKVNESREVKVGFDHTPTLDSEKIFVWSFSGDKIKIEVDGKSDGNSIQGGTKCTVTGLKAGKTSLRVTNTYNEMLSREFSIEVIEFDEEKDYLWQYASSDRAQFGYDSTSAKQGIKEGDAVLNGITWHFKRSSTTSLQSSMGAIGFGKNTEPETSVHLETTIDRVVKDFKIEAASAKSLGTMTIKVNDVVYPLDSNDLVDGNLPNPNYDIIPAISTTGVGVEKGKIEIDFSTPPYNPAQAEDLNYKVPGAVYLKSILIHFEDAEPVVTTEIFNFKEMYDDTEDGIFDSLTTSAKPYSFTQNDFTINFESVKKESSGTDEKIPGYAHCNGYIDIALAKSDEVISYVEFKFTYGNASSKNVYSLNKSKSGGAPFVAVGASSDPDGLLKLSIYDNNINALSLSTKNSFNVGLEYLIIKTKSGVNPTIKEIAVPEVFEPSVKNYVVGETFNVSGLPNLSIVYNEEEVEADVLTPNDLEWFDGPSYSTETPSKELNLGTTYVVGVFRGNLVVTINGLTVADAPKNLSIVKSLSEISSSDQIYLIEKSSKALIKGSTASNMGKASNDGVATLSLESVGDEISIPGLYRNDYYTVSVSSGLYSFTSTTDYMFGMTNNGTLSTSKSPNVKKATVTINSESGVATIRFDKTGDSPKTGYLYFDGSIALSSSETANLCLYKVV